VLTEPWISGRELLTVVVESNLTIVYMYNPYGASELVASGRRWCFSATRTHEQYGLCG
jgi:hypothetical protein